MYQHPGSDGLREKASKQSDSLRVQRSPKLTETSKDHGSETTEQKQREKLDWFSTWEDE